MTGFGKGAQILAVLALLALALPGCAPPQDPATYLSRDATGKRTKPLWNSGAPDQLMAALPEFGLLASAGYNEKDSSGSYCPAIRVPFENWQPVIGYNVEKFMPDTPVGRIKIPGFDYRLFVSTSKPKRAAIVFRGTDFTSFGDWYSNTRWLTRINPLTWDQYQQARDLTEKLVARIERLYGSGIEIIAVGHSLGGGLAQQAAYTSNRINTVYAFNTSPVTGATSIDYRVTPEARKGVKIYRIYESGEVLAGLRWSSRRVLPLSAENPRITEIRLNFRSTRRKGEAGTGIVGQHAMKQVACDLVCHVTEKRPHSECVALRQRDPTTPN